MAAHSALQTLESFTTMPKAENQRHQVQQSFNTLYEIAWLYRDALEGGSVDEPQ
ncbi:hypothetical protein [Streptomyces hygroscopicus]|uniref:hypothetical protein n=1 Tax=Streptomyces hygroscopicus TaxID=1912 RepID=UPI000A689BE1|nr:hypothetical protein [Streptomyces hygroscopicus]